MSKWVDLFFGQFGLGLIRVPGRNFDNVLQDVLRRSYSVNDQIVVFDVGAHEGESIERFKRMAPGRVRLYSFEPAIALFSKLQERYANDKSVSVFHCAVGAVSGTLKFNFHATATGSSSVVGVVADSAFAIRRNLPGNVKVEEVPSISLDQFVSSHPEIGQVHILKIDVQGYEEEVFEGAQGLIEAGRVDIIEAEVIIGQAYERNTSFLAIEKRLIPYGYRMIAASPDGRVGHGRAHDLIQNPELQFDAIYVAPHIHEKIWRSRRP